MPNVPATRNTMIGQLQKAFRAGSRRNPLHVENPAGVAVPIRNCTPSIGLLQFVILCQACTFNSQSYALKERECNCLRGQVNGQKTTCTSPCPPPIRAPVLTNEFRRIFSILCLYFVGVPLLRVILLQARRAGGQGFLVGRNRMLGLGFGLFIRAECGHCGHTLVPAVVNWLVV
jgi:hypothetical protein